MPASGENLYASRDTLFTYEGAWPGDNALVVLGAKAAANLSITRHSAELWHPVATRFHSMTLDLSSTPQLHCDSAPRSPEKRPFDGRPAGAHPCHCLPKSGYAKVAWGRLIKSWPPSFFGPRTVHGGCERDRFPTGFGPPSRQANASSCHRLVREDCNLGCQS
jgi:hypothetical protein